MRTKIETFKRIIELSPYDVILLSESWLKTEFSICEVKFAGYEVYRTDRDPCATNKEKGGGVLIAVRSCFKSRLIPISTSLRTFEHIFVSVHVSGQTLVFGCTYIAPSSPLDLYLEHCSVVEDLVLHYPNAKFYLGGDYNLTSAVWGYDVEVGNMLVECPPSYPAIHVCESFNCLSLFQANALPNNRGKFLDLLFCNTLDTNTSVPLDPIQPESFHHNPFTFVVPISGPVEMLDNQHEYLEF